VRLDQGDQRCPWHDRLHFREKLFAFGLLLSGCELVIREAELLTAHQTCPGLRLRLYCRAEGMVFRVSLGRRDAYRQAEMKRARQPRKSPTQESRVALLPQRLLTGREPLNYL
jgi:hypothetical protein